MPEPRRIPDPGFAGDDGSVDPRLRSALESYGEAPGRPARYLSVFQALQRARLLVPVVAVPAEVDTDDAGPAREKTTDMATVLLTGSDGRIALLAFSGVASLVAWRADARPVPVTAADAARSAMQEGVAALVLDVAGPTTYVVESELLEGLARGWTLVRTGDELAWLEEPTGDPTE